jgi:hypothetical protein
LEVELAADLAQEVRNLKELSLEVEEYVVGILVAGMQVVSSKMPFEEPDQASFGQEASSSIASGVVCRFLLALHLIGVVSGGHCLVDSLTLSLHIDC